jgi:hypothetical protein
MASAVGRGGSTELRTGARSIGLGVVYLRALREPVAALRDAGVASSSSFDVRERERVLSVVTCTAAARGRASSSALASSIGGGRLR